MSANPLYARTHYQVFHLWKLAGGDLITVLKQAGLIKIYPSITKMSKSVISRLDLDHAPDLVFFFLRFVTDQGDTYGSQKDLNTLFDENFYKLSLDELESRVTKLPIEIVYPLLEGG